MMIPPHNHGRIRGPGPDMSRWIVLATTLLAGTDLLRRHLWTPVELWPDVVCQAYVGWRVAAGESLYLSIWESHPPLAVLYSALLHLVAPPTIQTAHALVLSMAILYGTAVAIVLRARGAGSALPVLAIATLAAGAYSSLIANARSEDFVIVLGTAAIGCAYRYFDRGVLRWALAAGALAALAMFAKPAAVVAACIAGLLVLLRRPFPRGMAAFAGTGLAVAALFAMFFLSDNRYVAFMDQVVRYGRAYFRPLTAQVLAEGLGKAFAQPTIYLLATLAGTVLFALRRPRSGWTGVVVLAAWPVLELSLALLQTTYFPYVFFPLHASLMTLICIAAASCLPRQAGDDAPPLARVGALRAIAALAVATMGLYLVGHRSAEFRAMANRTHNTQLEAFASVLKEHRASYGGRMLWLDAGPGIGYLAGARQVIPEYVSPPLFNPAYTDETRWQRARKGLAQADLLTIWTEWYELDRNWGALEAFPSFTGFRSDVHRSFDKVGRFAVYEGRGPVSVYIRKGRLPALRAALSDAMEGAQDDSRR